MSVHHVVRNGPGAAVDYQDRSLSQVLTSEEIGKLLSVSNARKANQHARSEHADARCGSLSRCGPLVVCARFVGFSNYLRTAKARGAAFLLIPAARGSNQAGRKTFRHCWKNLHDACGQPAARAVEVGAAVFVASRRNAKYLPWSHRCSTREQLIRDGNVLIQIPKFGPLRHAGHHAEQPRVLHVRLSAGAKQRFGWRRSYLVHHRVVAQRRLSSQGTLTFNPQPAQELIAHPGPAAIVVLWLTPQSW